MLRRSTWFALVILAGLIALTFYLRREKSSAAIDLATSTPESQAVFGPEEGLPNSIIVTSAAEQGTFEMDLGSDNAWMIQKPLQAKAEPAQAEAAATQVGALRILDQVDLTPDVTGLTQPAYTFTLGFAAGTRHVLEIGDLTPSTSGYYARLDGGPVIIISAAGIQGLLGLLDSPPYLETPTPSPVPPTGTPVPPALTENPAVPSGTPVQ